MEGGGKEYEVKVLDIDPAKIVRLIHSQGGRLVHDRMKYYRAVFRLADDRYEGYGRVRKEGPDTMMTVKLYRNKDFPDEYEIKICDDFNKAIVHISSHLCHNISHLYQHYSLY